MLSGGHDVAAAEHRGERPHAPAPVRRCAGNTFCRYQVSASGRASRRSVSAVGAQSTTSASQSPASGQLAHRQQRQHLVDAGQHGELVGGDRVDAAAGEHVDQEALHVTPGRLEPQLGVDLHAPTGPAPPRAGSPVERHAQRVAERVRGVGRQQQRLDAAVGQPQRGRRGGGRLADAALAGEQHDPHAAADRLDPLLQLLQRGVHDDPLGLALEQAEHRDRQVDGEASR